MRLLRLKSTGEVSLTKNYINNIPDYTILSHTWGKEGEEVTLKDLLEGSGSAKIGYQKIQRCGRQASIDGLEFFIEWDGLAAREEQKECCSSGTSTRRWRRDLLTRPGRVLRRW